VILGEVDYLAGAQAKVEAMIANRLPCAAEINRSNLGPTLTDIPWRLSPLISRLRSWFTVSEFAVPVPSTIVNG